MFLEFGGNFLGQLFSIVLKEHIIHISNITFLCNRYSAKNKNNATGRFRIELLLGDDAWSRRYNTPKNDKFCNSSTQ